MENKTIELSFNDMHLHFEVLQDNSVRLLSLGLTPKNPLVDAEKGCYRPVEVQVLGEDQNGHHGLKNCETSFGLTSKYVGHEINEHPLGQELILTTRSASLEVRTHYVLCSSNHTIVEWNEVKNISDKRIRLEFVSSYLEYGLGKRGSLDPFKKLYFHTPHSSWYVEAQWERDSFRHLGLYNGNHNTDFKRHCLNNTGAWSTKEYLPMCVIEDLETSDFELVEIEETGSWHLEVGDVSDKLYLSASGPTHFDNDWTYPLNPGETYTGSKATVSFGHSFEEVIQEITKYRRLIVRPSLDHKEMPIIFNDYMHCLWDRQTEDLVLPLLKKTKEAGADLFVMDAGWFAEGSGWWNILGVWEEEKANWPHGLRYVCDKIREAGMKVGLWTEIEAMGIDCPLFKKLPKDWFFQIDGEIVVEHHRAMLDFSNPEVYSYAMETMDRLIDTYGLDYIKNDYNTDAGVGSDRYSSSFGEGLARHYQAFTRWIKELLDKHPSLTLENCASGGNRMDYKMLSLCPIQSTSDQTDYRLYPYLSGNVLTAVTPEQAAVWAYPTDLWSEGFVRTPESVTLNMVNAMLGRIHLASDLALLNEEEMNLVKEGVKVIKSLSEWKKKSLPIYPIGISHWGDEIVVNGLIGEGKIILTVTNLSRSIKEITVDLKPYHVKDIHLAFPFSLKTPYSFEDGVLKVTLPAEPSGRLFEGETL